MIESEIKQRRTIEYKTSGIIKGQFIELTEVLPIQGQVKIILIQELEELNINIILEFLKHKLSEWKEKYFLEKIGVFGSYSRGEAKPDSDIDIIVKFSKTPQDIYMAKNTIRETIETRFHKKVDLANEKFLKSIAKEHILKDVIYVVE
jgi:predicted nucleotidyltransferase